jgi:hypothetical protein
VIREVRGGWDSNPYQGGDVTRNSPFFFVVNIAQKIQIALLITFMVRFASLKKPVVDFVIVIDELRKERKVKISLISREANSFDSPKCDGAGKLRR